MDTNNLNLLEEGAAVALQFLDQLVGIQALQIRGAGHGTWFQPGSVGASLGHPPAIVGAVPWAP